MIRTFISRVVFVELADRKGAEIGEVTGVRMKQPKPDEPRTTALGDEQVDSWKPKTFGTIDCGIATVAEAWTSMEHRFSVGDGIDTAVTRYPKGRITPKLLRKHPVDVLVVERGHFSRAPSSRTVDQRSRWEVMVATTPGEDRPQVVIEMWPDRAIEWAKGPMSKCTKTRWRGLGYFSRFQRVNATTVGGAIQQTRLIVVRVSEIRQHLWCWQPKDVVGQARPMSNLLMPVGLVPGRSYRIPVPEKAYISDPQVEAMPSRPGSWIRDSRGIPRLTLEEMAKGLGVTKQQMAVAPLTARMLNATTSIFHWEFLSESLLLKGSPDSWIESPSEQVDTDLRVEEVLHKQALHDQHLVGDPDTHPIEWRPPDLREGGEWYQARMQRLIEVAQDRGNQAADLIREGQKILETHRGNYTTEGPKARHLQLIWWEFSPLHRDAIQEGSSMNFLEHPPTMIHPNSEMTPEQVQVAGEFVDKLVDLGVVGFLPDGTDVQCDGPLFCVPKPGQPGQWRVISNMKDGGQNAYIAADPVYLNRPVHILEQMYEGGYSAVVDASKFFYQFSTHPDDRPWLGILHPVTLALLVYLGLPMGSGNSPAMACRYGLSMLRALREGDTVFSNVTGKPNCWWTSIVLDKYNPQWGYGLVFKRRDGKPAVRAWVHVDDFLIHGPDKESTQEGLQVFLDLSVRVGMLCHPGKLYPPSQVQGYTGFIFDTRGIPTLRIPVAKRERALAMVEHLLQTPRAMSRLALSVVSGTLESMVEATPSRIGHTVLRSFHSLVHPPGYEAGEDVYYTSVELTPTVEQELHWWKTLLRQDVGRPARSARSATLVPTFGDGSGTGTGGTFIVPDQPLTTWMGQWTPVIYSFSSN